VAPVSDVAICTATIPERADMLAAAQASVQAQTHPAFHVVVGDPNHEGDAVTRNRAVEAALAFPEIRYVGFLDDDDVLYPRHVEVLRDALEANPDALLAYPTPHVEGEDWSGWQPQKPEALRHMNWIPVTVLCRRAVFDEMCLRFTQRPAEDWHLWIQLLDAAGPGAFLHVPEVTWVYRFHTANQSRQGRQTA